MIFSSSIVIMVSVTISGALSTTGVLDGDRSQSLVGEASVLFYGVRLPIITKKHPFLKESDGLSVRMIEDRMPLSVKNFYDFTRS